MDSRSSDNASALVAQPARSSASALVQLEEVSKRFSSGIAVDRLSLDVGEGEFFALLGPSGCGKTTLLRMLAGLEAADHGRILLDGRDLALVPPHRRPINMMFQNYALFPHLNVENNVAFGLKQDEISSSEIASRVAHMLSLVRLQGYEKRKPHQLSGGERQRVALARSLAKRPRLLLLDEPLAALDKKLRNETQFELMNLQKQLGLTFIIVTHDQQEAMTMADRIGVMNHGRLIQVGPPSEIYEQPNSRWIADFIGDVNLIEAKVLAAEPGSLLVASSVAGELRAANARGCKPGETVWVALRPEKVRISRESPSARDANCVAGKVGNVGYLGEFSLYRVRLECGFEMKAMVPNIMRIAERAIKPDDSVWLSWSPDTPVVLTR
ncbi:MAG TPA: ABC transporter ATP-binding protein [Xanthobacteraceae bacterium]|jgi:putrescine transport system ATP-binding protein